MTHYFGHEVQEQTILSAFNGDRLHHGWLLAGPQGLGKSGFAWNVASHIVTREPGHAGETFDPDLSGAAGKLLGARQHPDVHVLKLGPKDDKQERLMLDGKDFELARSIRIDQVRALQQRLHTRPTMGRHRCIVVDSIDLLERNAANALLKTLEEPPQNTFLFLISHNPGKLLATIRSRCQMLRFEPLSDERMQAALAHSGVILPPAAIDRIIAASGGAPGRAIDFLALEMLPVHAIMRDLVQNGDSGQGNSSKLAAMLRNKANRERLASFVQYAPLFAAQEIRRSVRCDNRVSIAAWEELGELARLAPTYNFTDSALVLRIGGLLAQLAPFRVRTQ